MLMRVDQLLHHPIVDRYGTVATVIVTPSETPRQLSGARLMFRGSLLLVDEDEISGRVTVFASVTGFGGLTAGQPAAFKARISRPRRRDLSVAVLSAAGEPRLGEAAPVQRAAQRFVRHSPPRPVRPCLPTRPRCFPRSCSVTPRRCQPIRPRSFARPGSRTSRRCRART